MLNTLNVDNQMNDFIGELDAEFSAHDERLTRLEGQINIDPADGGKANAGYSPNWEKDEQGGYHAVFDVRKLRGQLTTHNPPVGSGVMAPMMNEIWHPKLETGMALLDMVPMVEVGDGNGAANSMRIQNVVHSAIANDNDPAASGSAVGTSHTAQYRASVIKIGWPQALDIEDIFPALNRVIELIYRNSMFTRAIAVLKGAANVAEVNTGVAAALPTAANTPGKIIDLCLAIAPQYRDGSVLVMHDGLLTLFYQWSLTNASARGISDFIGPNPEMQFLNRSTIVSNLPDDGNAANEISAYCVDPMAMRIYSRAMLTSRIAWDARSSSWYLFAGSRFEVVLLDALGAARLKTAA